MENIINTLISWLSEYIVPIIVFLGAYLFLKVFKAVFLIKLKAAAKKTRTKIDDIIIKAIEMPSWFFYFIISLYVAIKFVEFSPKANRVINLVFLSVFAFYLTKAIVLIIDSIAKDVIGRKEKEEKGLSQTAAISLLSGLAKATVWSVAVLIVLDSFGINISALVAGLGIGGVAIAFALQNILADIFASFSIYFDKPFKIGDFIVVGDEMGTVKKIGIKSTRIQSLQGEEIVISNKELTESRIHNYGKMEKRRIVFNFSVEYETEEEKLKEIPGVVRQIFSEIDLAEIDRVHFKELGDSGLIFEVVYYIDSSDYNKYMDIQQEINLKLKKLLEGKGISFAYPSQKIYLSK